MSAGRSTWLDADPYTDCFWGILTGFDAAAELRIAKQTEPMTIRKVAAGTEFATAMVDEGVWYCELNQGKMVKKEPGQDAEQQRAPNDTTQALVDTLNDDRPDLFITSGHATERDWQLGYPYPNGSFRCADGELFGLDMREQRLPIRSPNPKVYLPIGNCLMGNIDRRDCMALAWMNAAGVHQMLGYTVPTWYGYMGWGVLDYFVDQPGRYTFTEAFFANHQALIHRLATCFPEFLDQPSGDTGRPRFKPGSGLGSEIMEALRDYANLKASNFTVYKVTNPKFYDRFDWLVKQSDGSYLYNPFKVARQAPPPAAAQAAEVGARAVPGIDRNEHRRIIESTNPTDDDLDSLFKFIDDNATDAEKAKIKSLEQELEAFSKETQKTRAWKKEAKRLKEATDEAYRKVVDRVALEGTAKGAVTVAAPTGQPLRVGITSSLTVPLCHLP